MILAAHYVITSYSIHYTKLYDPYLGRQTVLAGDVNSGKTAKTTEILNQFLAAGYARDLAILDLAPDTVQGIGGKMLFEKDPGVLYLTGKIASYNFV